MMGMGDKKGFTLTYYLPPIPSPTTYHRYPFDLDLCAVFKQSVDFYERHSREVLTHASAVSFTDFSCARAILALIGHEDQETRDHLRASSRIRDDSNDICESEVKLLNEIWADDLLSLVTADLACDEEEFTAGFSQYSVRVAARRSERFRIDETKSHSRSFEFRVSRSRSKPPAVAGGH